MNVKKIGKCTRHRFATWAMATIMVLLMLSPIFTIAQDPTGANTGTVKDLGIDTLAASSDTAINKVVSAVNTIAAADGHNKISINIMWTLICGFLVMFMQAGFALVETGFTRKKNVAHTMGMNFLVYALGMIGFWICGFALMFGGALNAATLGGAPGVIPHEYVIHMFGKDFGIAGTVGFFLNSKVYDVGVFTLFLFQMVFMDTKARITTFPFLYTTLWQLGLGRRMVISTGG